MYIKAGSLYESNEINGSTHFWEHILFRKLNHIYNGNIYQTLDTYGLSLSACTYKEFVSVKIKGAVKHFEIASKIISKVFEPIEIPSKEIELERKRVKSEMREDDEKSSLDYFTQKIVWKDTSLQNTVLGKKRVIDNFGKKALQDVQNTILSAKNVFFYVTGCFTNENIEFLGKSIESYQLTNGEIHQNIAPIPNNFFKRNCKIKVKNNRYHLVRFSFDIDTTRYTYAELDLLYDILFSGDSSRIYQELSEKTGYIYSFDARLERYNNLGNLFFTFEIQKKNILPAIEKIIIILKELKTDITNELSYVIPLYVDNAEFDLDDEESLNWNMAYECHIMNNKYRSIDERKKKYLRITPTRMVEIANEIFVPDNMIVTLKTKKKTFPLEDVRKIIKNL